MARILRAREGIPVRYISGPICKPSDIYRGTLVLFPLLDKKVRFMLVYFGDDHLQVAQRASLGLDRLHERLDVLEDLREATFAADFLVSPGGHAVQAEDDFVQSGRPDLLGEFALKQ